MPDDKPTTCPFCLEFVHQTVNPNLNSLHWPHSTRVVHRTNGTVIVPTIGSIVPNYLLIIPLEHEFSLRDTAAETLNEVISGIRMLERWFGGGTFFEHGSVDSGQAAGASIDHVHLHCLPVPLDLKKETPRLTYKEFSELRDIAALEGEYLFIRQAGRNFWTRAEGLPSQFLRRVVAKVFGVPGMWNWRDHPFVDNMKATYNTWAQGARRD